MCVIRIVCKRINLEVIRRDALAFRHILSDAKAYVFCVIEFSSVSIHLDSLVLSSISLSLSRHFFPMRKHGIPNQCVEIK